MSRRRPLSPAPTLKAAQIGQEIQKLDNVETCEFIPKDEAIQQYMDLLGVKVPAITIPVRPGRNLAIILEVAAMNNRQKKMGYNAAAEFTEQINRHFDETAGQSF